MKKASLGKDLASIAGSQLVTRIIGFVLVIVNRRLLGPKLVGVWNLVEVLRQQLASLTIGVHYSAERNMPIHRTKGEIEEENNLRSLMFCYLITEAIIIGIGYLIYWYFQQSKYDINVRYGLLIVPLLVVFNRISMAYQLAIRNIKAFGFYSWTNIVVFSIKATMVIYIILGKLHGVFVGLTVNGFIYSLLYWYMVKRQNLFKLRWRLNFKEIKALLSFGIPMGVWCLLYTLLFRIDSFVVASVLGTTMLGYYYLGPQLAAMVSEIPTAVTLISYPNLLERFGKEGIKALRADVHRYALLLSFAIVPITVSVTYFGGDFLIRYFLPKFQPGLEAIKVSLLIVVFWQLGFIYGQVLLVAKRIFTLIGITLVSVIALSSMLWCQKLMGLNLVGVAWARLGTQFCYVLLLIGAAYKNITGSIFQYATEWGRIIGSAAFWIFSLCTIDFLTGSLTGDSWILDILRIVCKESLFLACFVIFISLVQRTFLLNGFYLVKTKISTVFQRNKNDS